MSEPETTEDYADRLVRADERLHHAEDYVRDALRIMGQHKDADDPVMVRETAHRVLLSLYGRRMPR